MRIYKHLSFYMITLAVITGLWVFAPLPIKAQPEGFTPPPPNVTFEIVEASTIDIWHTFSGRAEAVNFAEIRPQVSGRIIDVRFEDGERVKKGQTLFVIDPAPFKANLDVAKAQLIEAENDAEFAQKEFNRSKELVRTNAISQRVNDQRAKELEGAKARVKRQKALVKQAQIDVNHAYIKAPFSGRLSRAEITLGNLVQSGQNAPVLTSIISDDGIYVDFEVDEQTYTDTVRQWAQTKAEENQIPVRIQSNNKTQTSMTGFIQSFDNRIDTVSGTIRARAFFANEDNLILPGMFVSIEMGNPNPSDVLTVSERAIGTNQVHKFVYIVNDNNMIEYRAVTLGQEINGRRIITSGIKPRERVITEGIVKLRPGMAVTPLLAGQENEAAE